MSVDHTNEAARSQNGDLITKKHFHQNNLENLNDTFTSPKSPSRDVLNGTIEHSNFTKTLNVINDNEQIHSNDDKNNMKANETDLLNETHLLDDKSLSFLVLDDSAVAAVVGVNTVATKNDIFLDLIKNDNGETTLVCLF